MVFFKIKLYYLYMIIMGFLINLKHFIINFLFAL